MLIEGLKQGTLGDIIPFTVSESGNVATSGTVTQNVPDFRTPADLLTAYNNFNEVNPADFVTRVSYSNGQAVTALSADPLTPGESRVMLNVPVYQPCAFEVEASVIRNRQQFATLTLFSNGEDGEPSPVPDQINIVNISQSSATAGVSIGDYVNLHGVRDSAGNDLALDGVWEVAHLSTSTAYFKPVYDLFGTIRTPVMPAIGTTNVNAGGTMLLRTTARVHDLMLESWQDNKVMIDGQGTSRVDKALPIYGLGGTVAVTQSTAAPISTTSGLGGWYIHPAIIGIADIASAAITSTATSSGIANNLGNGFQVNIAVTAATGTTPTMDVRVEESFDVGTNWVTLYEFQRITATGSYNSPILRASGRHIRYVRTIAGTSPSFTNAVTRNILPFMPSEPQKRIVDRTIVPNTLNSVTPVLFQGAANNIQLVVNMGAITTTAPQFQIEGSEDSANWYAIGSPLLAVASSTVEQTVLKSATFVRVRVSTAGSGATLGYVSLKAWS